MALTIPLSVNASPQTIPLEVTPSEHAVNLSVDMEARQVVNGDYNNLDNKPAINGVTLIGDKTSADLGIDQTYTHTQSVASATWTITHNLNKRPSVTVVDSGGTVVIGDVQYIDDNTIIITFIGAFSGAAYLN